MGPILTTVLTVIKHMFAKKALIYRIGTMTIKYGVNAVFGYMVGKTIGSIVAVSIMIGLEFIWYGVCEHRHGTDECPECGAKL